MTEKNDFKLDVVSIRLVKEAPIYSEQSFNKPEEVAAVMGDCMCQFDREVVCVVNLSSDLKYKMSRPNVQKILYKNVQLVCLS